MADKTKEAALVIGTKAFAEYYEQFNRIVLPWLLRIGDASDMGLLVFFSCHVLVVFFMACVPLQIAMFGFALCSMLLFTAKGTVDAYKAKNRNLFHYLRQVLWFQLALFGLATVGGMILHHYFSSNVFLKVMSHMMPYLFIVLNGLEIVYNLCLIPIHLNRLRQARHYGERANYLKYRTGLLCNFLSILKASLFISVVCAVVLFSTPVFLPAIFVGLAMLSIAVRRFFSEKISEGLLNKWDSTPCLSQASVHYPYEENNLFDAPLWYCSDRWELRIKQFLIDKKEHGKEVEASKDIVDELAEYILDRSRQAPKEKKLVLLKLRENIKNWAWEEPEVNFNIRQSLWRHEDEGGQTSRLLELTRKLMNEPESFPHFSWNPSATSLTL